ncbi:hypothetical protein JCM10449v2_007529 [Rhodotorula kratochvilovae]
MAAATPVLHPALARLAPLARCHPVRVASHSQIRALVAFSLEHLRHPDPAPLLLHCLPPAPSPSTPAKTLEASAAALPKLVSVAELVKREWLRLDPAPSSSSSSANALPTTSTPASLELHAPAPAPAPPREGLHQYTRLTSFEALGLVAPPAPEDGQQGGGDGAPHTAEEVERMRQELVAIEWLTGRAGKKRRPRRKHTPCMVVVLSVSPLDALPSSFTHQPPAPVKPPRNKKRSSSSAEPAAAAGAEAGAEGEGTKKRRRRRHKGGKKGEEGVEAKEGEGEGGMDVDEEEEEAVGA